MYLSLRKVSVVSANVEILTDTNAVLLFDLVNNRKDEGDHKKCGYKGMKFKLVVRKVEGFD